MVRVTLVDDDPLLLAFLPRAFAERGWTTRAFANPEAALLAMRRKPSDVLLLELFLRGARSAWELLEQLTADGRIGDLSIVVYARDLDRFPTIASSLTSLGIVAVSKPVNIYRLGRTIEAALQTRAAPSLDLPAARSTDAGLPADAR